MDKFEDLKKKLNGIRVGVGGCHQNKEEVFKYAWDNGCRLFDDGWGYSGRLVNTSFLGEFLKDKNHDDYVIVEKLPLFDKLYFEEFGVHIYEADDKKLEEMVDYIFNFQLKKLGVDYIDCYLLHALDDTQYSDNNYLTEDLYIRLYKILEKYKKSGQIKHLGFSAHIGFYRMFYLVTRFKEELGDLVDVAEVAYNILNDKGHTQKEPCFYARTRNVMVWDAVGDKGIKYLKEQEYFIYGMMPHESGRIGQISTSEDWFRWADRFALSNNENIDVVLEGTSYVPHFKMMLEEAGILKRDLPDMREIEGSSHRCHE